MVRRCTSNLVFLTHSFTGNPYPSYYGNSEGFNWISDECDQAPGDARQHIPVVKGGYFEEGGAAGKYRSVYCEFSNE